MSLAEYARYRGVSKAAVTLAVQAGRITPITGEDGKRRIDSDAADIQWNENSASYGGPRKKGVKSGPDLKEIPLPKAKKTPPPAPVKASAPPPSAPEGEDPPQSGGLPGPSYAQSRAIREAYAARMAKLEFEEKSGRLIGVDKVKVEAFKVARTVRDAILNIPDRISNELASFAGDPGRVHQRLTEELVLALEELVNANKRHG